jgi:hypothetical protein
MMHGQPLDSAIGLEGEALKPQCGNRLTRIHSRLKGCCFNAFDTVPEGRRSGRSRKSGSRCPDRRGGARRVRSGSPGSPGRRRSRGVGGRAAARPRGLVHCKAIDFRAIVALHAPEVGDAST